MKEPAFVNKYMVKFSVTLDINKGNTLDNKN